MTHCHVVFQTGGCLYITDLEMAVKRDTGEKSEKFFYNKEKLSTFTH